MRRLRGRDSSAAWEEDGRHVLITPYPRVEVHGHASRPPPLAASSGSGSGICGGLTGVSFRDAGDSQRARGAPSKPMSARQVHNVLTTLRGVLSWALRPDVRKLPAEFVNPLSIDILGHRPQKDPLRAVKLPLGLRIGMVQAMDAWQLCHLAPSFVLPMRPDEATGLLITDVDFRRRRLRFGTRFGGRDFNKGRRSFEVPFPPELDRLFNACMQGRLAGPLLRRRAVFEGREQPSLEFTETEDVETAYETALLATARHVVQAEQDTKSIFRHVLRRAGGATPDQLSREFARLRRALNADPGVRFYDTRAAVTTDMNRAGVPELELRYLTGHTTGDVLNAYVALDPDAAMATYFHVIRPLLDAITERIACVLG